MTTDTSDLLLDHYHCTFFLPLFGLEDKGFKPLDRLRYVYPAEKVAQTKTEEAEAQAWHYFNPMLRDILYDRGEGDGSAGTLQPVREWRLPREEIEGWTLELGRADNRSNPLQYQIAQVEAVTLYRYFNGIYLLAWRVAARADAIEAAGQDGCAAMRIENWLHFTRLSRVLFPSYPQQEEENKIQPLRLMANGDRELSVAFDEWKPISRPNSPGDILSPIVKYLLGCFSYSHDLLTDYWRELITIYDDRLFVSVAYSLAAEGVDEAARRKLYSLAYFVDRHADGFSANDGHVYTPDEVHSRIDEQTLWLWKGNGQYYGYSDVANVYLGSGGFFSNIVATIHVPYLYDRMLVQALFYQATLRWYDAQLAEDTPRMFTPERRHEIKARREAFLCFTNGYWFHSLTEQMQGKEIFRLQQKALGLKEQYDLIRDQLERTDELLRLQEAENQERFSAKLSLWGGILAVLGAWYAILGMWHDWWQDTQSQPGFWEWLGHWPDSDWFPYSGKGFLLTVIIIPAILAIGWWRWIRRKNRKARSP